MSHLQRRKTNENVISSGTNAGPSRLSLQSATAEKLPPPAFTTQARPIVERRSEGLQFDPGSQQEVSFILAYCYSFHYFRTSLAALPRGWPKALHALQKNLSRKYSHREPSRRSLFFPAGDSSAEERKYDASQFLRSCMLHLRDAGSERLARWTGIPLGSDRKGSHPFGVAIAIGLHTWHY